MGVFAAQDLEAWSAIGIYTGNHLSVSNQDASCAQTRLSSAAPLVAWMERLSLGIFAASYSVQASTIRRTSTTPLLVTGVPTTSECACLMQLWCVCVWEMTHVSGCLLVTCTAAMHGLGPHPRSVGNDCMPTSHWQRLEMLRLAQAHACMWPASQYPSAL